MKQSLDIYVLFHKLYYKVSDVFPCDKFFHLTNLFIDFYWLFLVVKHGYFFIICLENMLILAVSLVPEKSLLFAKLLKKICS